MITINIYGRDYVAPRAIDNDAAALGAYEADIRVQLERLATTAGIPRVGIDVPQFTAAGEYERGEDGAVRTAHRLHWPTLPAELHEQVKLPTLPEPGAAVAVAAASAVPDQEG